MNIAYGHQIARENDAFVKLAVDNGRKFSQVFLPGYFLVDVFPICKPFYFNIEKCIQLMSFKMSKIHPRMVSWCRVSQNREGTS